MSGSAYTWQCNVEGITSLSLGMNDLCRCHVKDGSNTANIVHKSKVKLSLQKPCPGSHFVRVDEEEMSVICKGYVPPNIAKNTCWRVSTFNEWRTN